MENRNPLRVFETIPPSWDFDLHIHTNWSQDNLDGPSMMDYIPLAERYKIHIGFADHFEMQYYRKYGGSPRNEGDPRWKLNPDTIDDYLGEVDDIKENYEFVSSGLEMDYYPEKKEQLQEFIDDYYDQFDLFIGSVHETKPHRPVTILEDFNWLVKKEGSFKKVLNQYWDLMFEMISDELFDAVAHPDVIYRFFSSKEIAEDHPEYLNDERVLTLGRECLEKDTLMEVNLSGLLGEWGQSFPKIDYVYNLRSKGVKFVVGSDSHTIEHFKNSILNIRKMNNVLKARTN